MGPRGGDQPQMGTDTGMIDAALDDPDNMRKGPAQQPRSEYVDYDDPTQFDAQGQRINSTSAAAAQTQIQLQQQQQHLQQQQMLFKQDKPMAPGGDRQLVSYDDLF